MASLVNVWAESVVRHRRLILAAAMILLPVMVFTGKAIPFDNSKDQFFLLGDPTLDNYRMLVDLFGDHEYLVIGIEQLTPGDDIFNAETLSTIDRLTRYLDSHRFVSRVESITNYQSISSVDDELSIDYLIDDTDGDYSGFERSKALSSRIADERLALGTLVSDDLRHARISVRVEYRADSADHKMALVRELYGYVEEENMSGDSFRLHYAGSAVFNEHIESMLRKDLLLMLPVMAVVMFIVLFQCFRSLIAVAMPTVVIGLGVLGVNELQSYLEFPHSLVDQALLPTMIIIGVGITVHVLVDYYFAMREKPDGQAASRTAIIKIWKPALMTALTTSTGFLALSVIRVAPIKEFAILGAIGPLILFFLSMTLLPALLSFSSTLSQRSLRVVSAGVITRATGALPLFTWNNRFRILICGLAALMFATFTLPRIEIDTNYIDQLKTNDPVRHDIVYFDENFKGVDVVDIILDSGEADGIKDPEFLAQVEEFQTWLAAREATGPVNSLIDYLKEINQSLNNDDPAFYRLPDSREMTAQFLLLYSTAGADNDFSEIKDFDNRYLRLVVPVINLTSREVREELDVIETRLQDSYPRLQPVLAGDLTLFTARDIYAAEGMINSFGVALLSISVLLLVLFRSFKYGMLAILCSALPILLAGGIAGLVGLKLNLNTMMVAAMTMGIAVDDSVHILNRYITARSAGSTTRRAIEEAMRRSGRALIFSSTVLVIGFSVFILASFTTMIHIGVFASLIMIFALLGDLFLLPAILYAVDGDG